MDKLSNILIIVAFIIGLIIGILISKNNYTTATGGIVQSRDSIGYEEVLKDTVIKWYEKIIYKQVNPKVTYIQTADTIFQEVIKDFDLIFKVIKKRNGDLTLFAFNRGGELVKKYEFENVGNAFQITSLKNNIFVKSNLWSWNGVYLKSEAKTTIDNEWKNNLIIDNGIYTGINFNNIIDLNMGIGYNKQTKFNINLETKIKLK